MNREDDRSELRPVNVLRNGYLFGKLIVLSVALLVLLLALGFRPRRRLAIA